MRVEWADIVSAARETSEALVGKGWVSAGIKARVLLADLADEVEQLKAENDRLSEACREVESELRERFRFKDRQGDSCRAAIYRRMADRLMAAIPGR
jgi:hypothetical protein